MVHLQPIVWTVRLFPEGSVYGDPFSGVCTVQQIGQHTIYISAMHGAVTRKQLGQMAEQFMGMGFKFVLMNRHGRVVQRKIEDYAIKKPSEEG